MELRFGKPPLVPLHNVVAQGLSVDSAWAGYAGPQGRQRRQGWWPSALVLLGIIHLFRVQDQDGYHHDQVPDKGACRCAVPCSASRVMSGAGGTSRPPARRVQVWQIG